MNLLQPRTFKLRHTLFAPATSILVTPSNTPFFLRHFDSADGSWHHPIFSAHIAALFKMRVPQSRPHTLLLLLPVLQVLATSVAEDTLNHKLLARAAVPAAVPAYTQAAFVAEASPAATSGAKGTKDAPVDGLDGKPHAGPYVDDTPKAHEKAPNVVEDLGSPKKPKASPGSVLVDKVLDGDKSVMQDPSRKLATGKTGTEGGVSAKDKERLAHEDKTGAKMKQIPESPKEAPPHPADQKHLKGDAVATASVTRALGAGGLEVRCNTIALMI